MKTIIISVLLSCCISSVSEGQVIVSLNGTPQFETSLLVVQEAGNDFSGPVSEIQGHTTINIQNNGVNNPNNYNYILDVGLMESVGTIGLAIERTGAGTNRQGGQATGRIAGGTPAIQLSTIPVRFVEGTGDRLNVPVRFSLTNLSVIQPAGNITFSLIFTATTF